MYSGGTKIQKTVKTKFKKNNENDGNAQSYQTKKKHHDKSFYRLKKQEEKEYDV